VREGAGASEELRRRSSDGAAAAPAKLAKVPGVSETLDWAAALWSCTRPSHPGSGGETMGCLVKDEADLRKVRLELEAGRLSAGAG